MHLGLGVDSLINITWKTEDKWKALDLHCTTDRAR